MSKEKGGTITRDRRKMNGKRKNRTHYLETENGLIQYFTISRKKVAESLDTLETDILETGQELVFRCLE